MVTDILKSAWRVITDMPNDWLLKILASGLFLLLARHMAIFTLFTIVVTIDLFSKFLSLSHQMEVDDGREDLSLVAAIRGIPEAHRRGIINKLCHEDAVLHQNPRLYTCRRQCWER